MMRAGFLLFLAAHAVHGDEPLVEQYASQLRCPFAKVWLEHGPDKAAKILGVDAPHRRMASVQTDVFGACTYTNSFANTDVCVEFRDTGYWTDESAKAKCDGMMTKGTLEVGGSCDTTTGKHAGWCSTSEGKEFMISFLGAGSATCEAAESACTTWSQGTFVKDGECADAGSEQGSDDTGGEGGAPAGPMSDGKCALAPGAIGAAHQLAMSPGYHNDCPGTPGQKSPYMWPMRWSANVESKGLKFGSDEIQYHSKGHVMYLLDRNWKRLDTLYQTGVQRAVGQGPCENPDGNSTLGCRRNSTQKTTMLHRQNKMTFINYHENGTISTCRSMDLGIIGNIRPDWFMDDRGDSTDVQYLGDSHVYYLGEPRLVKQWRKKDFASQYFTMSIQRLPGADGVHWPLILNVPGEGFGDDFLQHYSNHTVLGENDTEPFLIDDAFVAAGGSCPMMASSGSGSGPPTGQVEHVPSNLEVQSESWRSIVWTGSPSWQPPKKEDAAMAGGMEVSKDVFVETCFDEASSMLRLETTIKMETQAWASISWRETEECLMTPRGGGDSDVVWADLKDGSYSLHFGSLSPQMKHFENAAVSAFKAGLVSLSEAADFGKHLVEFKNGELYFSVERKYAAKPDKVFLSFAFGRNSEISYHKSRGCFEVTNLKVCKAQRGCPSAPTDESAPPAEQPERDVDTASTGGRRLFERGAGGGAVLTAFGLGAVLR